MDRNDDPFFGEPLEGEVRDPEPLVDEHSLVSTRTMDGLPAPETDLEALHRARPRTSGRPSQLTPEVHRRIVSLVRAGNYIDIAALAAGIPRDTFKRWIICGNRERKRLEKNPDAEPNEHHAIYVALAADVSRAIAECEAEDVTRLALASQNGDLNVTRWRLERRAPKRWGRNVAEVDLQLSGKKGGAPVELSVTERRASVLQKLARVVNQSPPTGASEPH